MADYPEDAGWLREHLIVAGALRTEGEPAAEKKDRARSSVLYAVAHPEVRVVISRGVRPGLAAVYAVMIFAACLVLTAGVAAGSGVDVGSFAQDVVDKLVEPLPISAETLEGRDTLGPGPQAAGNDAGSSGQTVGKAAAAESRPADLTADGAPVTTGITAQDDPPSLTIPLQDVGGGNEPTGSESDPPANDPPTIHKPEDHDDTPPKEDGPPGQDAGSSHGRRCPDVDATSGSRDDGSHQSDENGPGGGGPGDVGSNGSNGQNEGTRGPAHDSSHDESCGTNPSSGRTEGSR